MPSERIDDLSYPGFDLATASDPVFALSEARAGLTQLVNRAIDHGQRAIITRHGRAAAAIVPIAALDRLVALDRVSEDRVWIDDSAEPELVDLPVPGPVVAAPVGGAAAPDALVECLGRFVRDALSNPEVRAFVEGGQPMGPGDHIVAADPSLDGDAAKERRSTGG